MAARNTPKDKPVQDGDGWRPEPGDTLAGKIVDLDMSTPGQYDAYPILTIKRDGGQEVALHCFHFTLRSKLEQIRPNIGDPISVTYVGEKTPENGRPYHLYRVRAGVVRGNFWGDEPTNVPTPPVPQDVAPDDIPF